jgi:uncharacterized protein YegP (UPF0339 family)
MAGRYVIKKATNGQYHFSLQAGNYEPILTSELYTSLSGCTNGIESVRTNGGDDANFVRAVATNGEFYFTLRARNGETIGRSELYTTAAARDKGIESVKANHDTTSVVDNS